MLFKGQLGGLIPSIPGAGGWTRSLDAAARVDEFEKLQTVRTLNQVAERSGRNRCRSEKSRLNGTPCCRVCSDPVACRPRVDSHGSRRRYLELRANREA